MLERDPLSVRSLGYDLVLNGYELSSGSQRIHDSRLQERIFRLLGYTEEELTSLTFKDITHPEHAADDTLHVNDLLSGKIPLYRTEKRYVRKDKGVV